MNQMSKKYYKDVKNAFQAIGKDERIFLKKFKSEIERNESTLSTYQDYINFFDSPKEIVSSYYENISKEELLNKIAFSKKINIIVLIVLFVAFAYFGFLFKFYNDARESLINVEETIIRICD